MSISNEFRLDETTRNKLIELVKNFPILYSECSDRSRQLQDERQKYWEEIGEKLHLPAETCKNKFSNLKNNYYKNIRNDTVGPEMRRRCAFLDEQAPWNRQHEKAARITSRRQTKRPRMDYNEDSDDIVFINTSTVSGTSEGTSHSNGAFDATIHSNGINSTTTNSSRGLQFAVPHVNGDNNTIETNRNGHAVENISASLMCGSETDDLTSFFKNMEQTARKFNPRLQVKIKRMISDIIYDAEEQWLTSNQA